MNLPNGIQNTALAFRGYNVENLGRTRELLEIPEYRERLVPHLEIAAAECSRVLKRPANLLERIEREEEFTLEEYGEAISMIVAVEQGQLQILNECHGIDYHDAAFSFGFSLGEISALVAGGTFTLADALDVPLQLTPDGIKLAKTVRLGNVFSRKEELSVEKIQNTCIHINAEAEGMIGVSTHLSPNSVLVMGTGNTIELLRARLNTEFPEGTHLRLNDSRWPPIHTPIVWEEHFISRVGLGLKNNPGGFKKPFPDILSLVTGEFSYNDYNTREHMMHWVHQTQQMWTAICQVLHSDVQTIIHTGPDPNIIPSTFQRLSKNVIAQTSANRGIQALADAVDRPWLRKLLPKKTDLLRAPKIQHVILEDWLLENAK